jgi:hypothetical protein
MSRPIGDIYLKEVRTLLFVKMLILNLQNLSCSISAKEVSLPAIIVVSLTLQATPSSDLTSVASDQENGAKDR